MTDDNLINLRSDTFTRPGPGMYEAMASAPVGDDVYGEDESVNALEARTSELLGKPAGLFLSSATQANLVAMLVHCGRGEEVLLGEEYHIFQDEAGGASTLGGVVVHPLPTNETGGLSIEQVVAAIKADDFHNPITRLLSLENTVSGHLQDPEYHRLLAQTVRERGLNVHLDGARLMNAAVALGMPAADICAPFDSVMLCLSKGLGAPVGAMLCGQTEFIRKARRLRKMLGGGMRQAGIIAACGIYALDNNVERLAQDHANARRLAEGIAGIDNLGVECATNMVFIRPASADHEALREFLQQRQILFGDQRPAMRLVTHLDVSAEQIERVIAEIHNYYQTSPNFSPG